MPLCNLCAEIPWDNLPTLSKSYIATLTGYKYIHTYVGGPKNERRKRGHNHQPNLDALRDSAANCDLCKLILQSAEQVAQEVDEVNIEEEKIKGRRYAVPKFDLWLTRRMDGNPGAWVFSSTDEERNILPMAAIGLCTRDGESREPITNLHLNSLT
jgi:hypothetical protein